MEYFPGTLSSIQSRWMVENISAHIKSEGFGLWAVELKEEGEFIGFVGLARPKFTAHFTPCVEVGWRLAHRHWGYGYAVEAAKEAIRDGFERLSLSEIVSFTAAINSRSIRVMEKLGMKHNPQEDFQHPRLEEGDRLKLHVLYRLTAEDWHKNRI